MSLHLQYGVWLVAGNCYCKDKLCPTASYGHTSHHHLLYPRTKLQQDVIDDGVTAPGKGAVMHNRHDKQHGNTYYPVVY